MQTLLCSTAKYVILKTEKEQPPTRGWPIKNEIEIPPCNLPKFLGWFSMYDYLQNLNTNVSNAKRKRPKVIKSLKSNWFFIGITPILKRMRSSHPVTRLLHISIITYLDFSFHHFYTKFSSLFLSSYIYPHTISIPICSSLKTTSYGHDEATRQLEI